MRKTRTGPRSHPATGPAPAGRLARLPRPGPATVALAALIGLIWWGLIAPIGHYDVDVFLRAGAAVRHGENPYPAPGTPAVHSGYAFVYPYLVALPFAPLSRLGGGDEIFIALSVVAVLAGTRLAGARDWRVYALVIAASCTIIGFQMGTFNALLFAGLTVLWHFRDRAWIAGAVVALLVYSKLFLAPVLLWLLLTRRWRATAVALGGLAALFGCGELVSPLGTSAYAGMLNLLARAEAPDGLSLTGLLANVGLGTGAATSIARAGAAALIIACALATRRGHDERLLFAGTIAAALLASPIVWSHYLLLLAAPLLVLSVPRPGSGCTPTPVAVFAVGSWLLVTPHRTGPADLAAAAVVLAALTLSSIWGHPGIRETGIRKTGARVGIVLFGSAVVLDIGACLLLLAAADGHAGRVVGAYGTLLGTLALLGWAGRVTRTPDGLGTPDGPGHVTGMTLTRQRPPAPSAVAGARADVP